MQVPEVPGATGYIDSNFAGKAQAAKELFENGCDLVYVHMEAPDECGHRGEVQNKVRSIEIIDSTVVGPLLDYLKNTPHRVLIMPDHPTPLSLKTHVGDPVPYLLYDSTAPANGVDSINEETAKATGIFVQHGPEIMNRLLQK